MPDPDPAIPADAPGPESLDAGMAAAWEEAMAAREAGTFDAEAFRRAHPRVADAVLEELAFLDQLREKSMAAFVPDSAAQPQPAPTSGRFGDYELVRELGRGGQGIVYLAKDVKLGRQVALKMLTEAAARSEFMRQRFKREAEAASRLDHPGICSVFAIGEDNGIPFIAMRYVEGEPLLERIQRMHTESSGGGRPSATSSGVRGRAIFDETEIIEKAARALHVAHEAGLVHRDVKPGNIVVTPEDEPVLLDFGLARDLSDESSQLTLSGHMIGTPAYMAPEQIEGRPMDRRTDTYALGVTLFECLTGRLPFVAATRDQLCAAILHAPPPDPSRYNRAVPRDLAAITAVALDKDPDRRYATAEAFAEDLRRARMSEPIRARPPGVLLRMQRWVKRRPAVAALCFVLAVGAPVIGVLASERAANRSKVAEAEAKRRHDRVEQLLETGFLEASEGNPNRAIVLLEEALALEPDTPEAVLGMVRAHMENRDGSAALAVLDEHADLERRHPDLRRARVLALQGVDRHEEARALAEEVDAPASALGWFVAGWQLAPACESGDSESFRRAYDCFRNATIRSPRPLYYFELLHMAHHLKDRREVARLVEAIQALWPDSPAGRRRCARAFLATDPARAIPLFEAAIEQSNREELAPLVGDYGLALIDTGRIDEAIVQQRRSLAIDASNPRTHTNLANALVASGDVDAAIGHYRKAIDLSPKWAKVRRVLAEQLHVKGRDDEAMQAYREALEVAPRDSSIWRSYSIFLMDLGHVDQAVRAARKGVACNPAGALERSELAVALSKAGRTTEALREYERSIAIEDRPRTRSNLALLYQESGHLHAAIGQLREATRLAPDNAKYYSRLGGLLSRTKQLEDAIEAYRACAKRQPDNAKTYWRLGDLLNRTAQHEAAIEAYERAIQVDPRLAEVRVNLAALLGSIGRTDEAVAQLEAAIDAKPALMNAHYAYGHLLARTGKVDAAITAYREAIRLAPKYAESHCNLGLLYKRAGRIVEALRTLREGHRLGAMRKHWPTPSGEWIADLERVALGHVRRAMRGGFGRGESVPMTASAKGARDRAAELLDVLLEGWAQDRSTLSARTADAVRQAVRQVGDPGRLPAEEAAIWRRLIARVGALAKG